MEFGLLGPLHAQIAERAVHLNGPRQAKVLAALLINANSTVSLERLVAVMWDADAPATAVRQVQDAVSGLRRNLNACGAPRSLICTRRGGYAIHVVRDSSTCWSSTTSGTSPGSMWPRARRRSRCGGRWRAGGAAP